MKPNYYHGALLHRLHHCTEYNKPRENGQPAQRPIPEAHMV